jgi:hypothetical protein
MEKEASISLVSTSSGNMADDYAVDIYVLDEEVEAGNDNSQHDLWELPRHQVYVILFYCDLLSYVL